MGKETHQEIGLSTRDILKKEVEYLNYKKSCIMIPEYNLSQLTSELENDIERYPLPICFHPEEERHELYRRHLRLRDIAFRWMRMQKHKAIIKHFQEISQEGTIPSFIHFTEKES
jgi:hypothetical protein